MRKIHVFMTGVLLLLCSAVFAQKTVTGKVTDSKDGTPLPAVSVRIKGRTSGTATANDGTFTITLPKGTNTLLFSSIGFADQEVDATSAVINVSMGLSASSLNEVVVVGYGTSVKREITGVVARVKGADVQNMPVPNLNQALQGRAAGVFVESQNGKVGDGIKVRIRGATSINGSNQPLYVVDGIPLAGGAVGSSTADINFNDVESFEILKDAASSAIYGSRAANGVILITTKRGRNGKTRFNVGAQYGMNEPTNRRDFLNAQEYISLLRQAGRGAAEYHMRPDGGNNANGFADLPAAYTFFNNLINTRLDRYSGFRPFRGGKDWRPAETGAALVDTDWQDAIFQDAPVSQFDISAQGGNDKTKFFIAANLNDQNGILVTNRFRRMGARINLDNQVNDWLKIGITSNLSKITRNRVPDDNAFSTPMQAVALAPITPIRDSLGLLFDRPVATYYNPLIEFESGINRTEGFRNQGSIYANINLAKGLTLHTDLGLDMIIQNETRYWGPRTLTGAAAAGGTGQSSEYWFRNTRWMTNNYLTYAGTYKSNHKYDVTAGFAFENLEERFTEAIGEDFADSYFKTVGNTVTPATAEGSFARNNLVSGFGRLNYSYAGKYLLSGSVRLDADSRFGSNSKSGVFAAGSLGWIMTEENFMKGIKFLSFLKPRISYGTTGNNSGIGFYDATTQYGPGTYGNAGGLRISRFGNDDLRWESTASLSVGLDFGLFNNRITGEIDWYEKLTTDMLLNTPTPATSGTQAVFGNIGSMTNKGVEFTLNTVNVSGKNFRWSTSFNLANNRNKLTKLDGDQQEILPADSRFANAIIVGKPLGVFWAPKFLGANPDNGDPVYVKTGGGTTRFYDEAEKMVVGDPNPDWIGGINNTVSWKGLELSVLFQGVFGNQVQDGAGGFMSAGFDWFDNQTRDQLGAWKQKGDVTMVPQARLGWLDGNADAINISSRYVYDASYVRLKNLSLAYSLPAKLMTKLGLQSARFYATAVNLLTFTDYPGWDPEVNTDYRSGNVNQGSDFYAAPQIKSVVFGLNIGF
ncbi:MAG: TonB-dependent receptor [Bacteroidetes bacterium]|nr:MAG: TonB-dependent receptor [Bacteroidota bacterium]